VWARFVGEAFACGWDVIAADLERVAYFVALNIESTGGTVDECRVEGSRAEIMARWPTLDGMAEFAREQLGLTRGDIEAGADVFEPIMRHVGVSFHRAREGDSTRIVLTR
jgi:hypothetical protein